MLDAPPCEPVFFAGICQFENLSAYRQSLEERANSEKAAFDVYVRQVFSLAKINAAKYKNLRRATFLLIVALAVELGIIVFLFINYLREGALPKIV